MICSFNIVWVSVAAVLTTTLDDANDQVLARGVTRKAVCMSVNLGHILQVLASMFVFFSR